MKITKQNPICPSCNSKNTWFELQEQNLVQDIKYQNITYYKQNCSKIVKSEDVVHIDFIKAMSEMENLNWNEFNHIGFVNHRTNENVQFIRKGKNNWYAEVPIDGGLDWRGYYWGAYSDNKTISNMMRLFFEETEWFGMLRWKFRRYYQR